MNTRGNEDEKTITCNQAIKKMQNDIKIIKACYKEYVTDGNEAEQIHFFRSGEFQDMFEAILEYEYQCDVIFAKVDENKEELKEFEAELEKKAIYKKLFYWVITYRNNSNLKIVKKLTDIRSDIEMIAKDFNWFELHIQYLIPNLKDFKPGQIQENFAREKLAEALEMLEEDEKQNAE